MGMCHCCSLCTGLQVHDDAKVCLKFFFLSYEDECEVSIHMLYNFLFPLTSIILTLHVSLRWTPSGHDKSGATTYPWCA